MARLCKACVDKNFVICVTMSSNGFTVFYTSRYTATLYLVFLYIYKYKEREKFWDFIENTLKKYIYYVTHKKNYFKFFIYIIVLIQLKLLMILFSSYQIKANFSFSQKKTVPFYCLTLIVCTNQSVSKVSKPTYERLCKFEFPSLERDNHTDAMILN